MSSAERGLQEEPKREKGSTRSDTLTLVQGLSRANRVARHTVRASALSFLWSSLKERNAAFVTAAAVSSCSDVVGDVVVAAAVRSSAFEMTAVVPTTDSLLQTPNRRGARTSDPAPATRPPTHSSAASMWRTSLARPAPLLRRLLHTADVILHSSGSITTKPGPLASRYGTPRPKKLVATNHSLHHPQMLYSIKTSSFRRELSLCF